MDTCKFCGATIDDGDDRCFAIDGTDAHTACRYVGLFVYGTLLTGEADAAVLDGCKRDGAYVLGGRLHHALLDGNDYPAMVLSEKGGHVWGDLVTLDMEWPADVAAFERVRHLEHVRHYRMTQVAAFTREGSTRAWTFEWDGASGARLGPIIESGRWTRRASVA